MQLFRLRGKLADGMFPNELVVVVTDHRGERYALIVPRDMVQQAGDDDGVIEVRLVDHDQDIALVRLPGELVTSGRMISVKDSQLEPV